MPRAAKTVQIDVPLPASFPEPACAPCPPCEYPTTLSLDFPEDSGVEIPEEGTIVLEYKRRRKTEDDDREKCSYDLTITRVVSVTEADPTDKPKSAEDALAEYAGKK